MPPIRPLSQTESNPVVLFLKSYRLLAFTIIIFALGPLLSGTFSTILFITKIYYPDVYRTLFKAAVTDGPIISGFPDDDGSYSYDRYEKHWIMVYVLHVWPIYIWSFGSIYLIASGMMRHQVKDKTLHMDIHKGFGYLWMFSSVLIGLSAFGMMFVNVTYSHPTFHSSILTFRLLTWVLTTWYFWSLGNSYYYITRNNIRKHQLWIFRHVFSGLSVGLFRWLLPICAALCENQMIPLDSCILWKGQKQHATIDDQKIMFSVTLWVSSAISISVGEVVVNALGLTATKVQKKE